MNRPLSSQLRHPRRSARGFMLLEALVALLIFSFGVLGVVGLQATMTQAQTTSKLRAEAAFLANQLIGTMWSDRPVNLPNYATASCGGYGRCSDWAARVAAALPSGTATVDVATTNVTISIHWTKSNEEPHTFTTSTAIAMNAP